MKMLITLIIALALVGCSGDDGDPVLQFPDAGMTICDDPTGNWYVTIVWGQGTCNLPTPSTVIDLPIAKVAEGTVIYAVHSSVGEGTLATHVDRGVCTLSVAMSQPSSGVQWTMDIRPDKGGAGSGTYKLSTSSGDCTQDFAVTNYEER